MSDCEELSFDGAKLRLFSSAGNGEVVQAVQSYRLEK